MNDVILSPDRKHMTIISEDGHRRAELRSQLPDGFTPAQKLHAETRFTFGSGEGVSTCRRYLMFGHPIYLYRNSGPPTWRLPRILVDRHHFGVGWLRDVVVVHW